MTVQEAINQLKFDIEMTKFDPTTGEHTSFLSEETLLTIEAEELAIEALEKQIPKFVECKEWKGIRNTRYKCPYCGKNVRNDETYCHKCGQAVKFPKLKKVDNRLELDWN